MSGEDISNLAIWLSPPEQLLSTSFLSGNPRWKQECGMGWLSAFITANLIGIGSNFDNFGTGMAYGSNSIKIPHWVNGIINVIGFCTALIGAYLGKVISQYITFTQASWAACVALVCIGMFFWYSRYLHPLVAPTHRYLSVQVPGWKQGIILGCALSLTNIAVGFGATIAIESNVYVTAFSIAFWGYIMIWMGNTIGIGVLAKWLGKYSSFVAGLLLIVVGVHQVMVQ